jgi:hypothetical protein
LNPVLPGYEAGYWAATFLCNNGTTYKAAQCHGPEEHDRHFHRPVSTVSLYYLSFVDYFPFYKQVTLFSTT